MKRDLPTTAGAIPNITVTRLGAHVCSPPFEYSGLTVRRKSNTKCHACRETISVGEQYLRLIEEAIAKDIAYGGIYCLGCIDFHEVED